MDYLIPALIGFAVAALIFILLRSKLFGPNLQITIQQSIEKMRAVGELVVFKVVSRQIVTAEKHSWGAFAKQWLSGVLSTKKMAIIIEYGVDFKYDLRDPAFDARQQSENNYQLTMPPCRYDIYVRDIRFYDEQTARVLPFLLGNIGSAIGGGFSEEEKNQLLEEARTQAKQQAEELVKGFEAEVQGSARRTMESLALSFGAEKVDVQFSDNITKDQETTQSPRLAEVEKDKPTA